MKTDPFLTRTAAARPGLQACDDRSVRARSARANETYSSVQVRALKFEAQSELVPQSVPVSKSESRAQVTTGSLRLAMPLQGSRAGAWVGTDASTGWDAWPAAASSADSDAAQPVEASESH